MQRNITRTMRSALAPSSAVASSILGRNKSIFYADAILFLASTRIGLGSRTMCSGVSAFQKTESKKERMKENKNTTNIFLNYWKKTASDCLDSHEVVSGIFLWIEIIV